MDGSFLIMVRKNKGLLHTALVSGLAMVTAACGSIDSKATQATTDTRAASSAPAPQLPMPVATLGDAAVQQGNQKTPAVSLALKQIDQLNQQQQYEQSLALTQQLLKQYPDSPDLALMEGALFNQLERTDEAEQVFLALSEKHPELPEPLNNLAVIYVNRGDLNRAISTLQKAFETHPSYARVQSNLRTLYTTLASQAYNRALNLGSQAPAPVLAALDRIPNQSALGNATHNTQQIAANEPPARIILTGGPASSTSLTSEERASIQADVIRAAQAVPSPTTTAAASTESLAKPASPAVPVATEAPVALAAASAEKPVQTVAGSTIGTQLVVAVVSTDITPTASTEAPVKEPEASSVDKGRNVSSTPTAVAATSPAKTVVAEARPVKAADHHALLKAQVLGWAAAWSAQDVPAYLSFYTDNFRPANRMSNKRWKKQRQQRLTKPKKIEVKITGISIRIKNDTQANVSFTQHYRADHYRDKVIKTLTFKQKDGDWKIAEEVSRKVR